MKKDRMKAEEGETWGPLIVNPLLLIGENFPPPPRPTHPVSSPTALTYASYCPRSGIFCLEKRC